MTSPQTENNEQNQEEDLPIETPVPNDDLEKSPEVTLFNLSVDYSPMAGVDMNRGNPLGAPRDKTALTGTYHLSLPTLEAEEYSKVIEQYPNLRVPFSSQEAVQWATNADLSKHLFLSGGAFNNCFNREEAEWKQGLVVGSDVLRADRPKFGESSGRELTGEEARLFFRAAISSGDRARIPLYHTGIWITIKAPTERELEMLDLRLAREKVNYGWRSLGHVFSSQQVFFAETLIDFILEHVITTSYYDSAPETLRKVILQPDYMQMVYGLLCAMYPDGHMYEQSCMVDPTKCRHVESGVVSFGKMEFVDNRQFTDFQRQHMRKRNPRSQSKADVERYQSEHKYNRDNVVKLKGDIVVELKVPTLEEYIKSGHGWINGMVESIDSAFGKELNANERMMAIIRQTNVSALQQYSHWVRQLSDVSSDRHVVDRETLEETLADLTSDDAIYDNFTKGVKAYMDRNYICAHGLPKMPCPSCGESPSEELSRHPHVFPIDLVEVFFTLVAQRLQRMAIRLAQ